MDRAASLIFPGSKTLAGWWGQVAVYRPLAMSVGYGYVHRIEAPVTVSAELPIAPLHHLILQALALEPADPAGVATETLYARLGLPTAMLRRVSLEMAEHGLLLHNAGVGWRSSATGTQALERKFYPRQVPERRVFPFLESVDAHGHRVAPAQYLPIGESPHVAWQVDELHRFDVAWLRSAIAQSADWKSANAFPQDIVELVQSSSADGRDVILDRSERILFVLLLAGPENAREVLGFGANADGWRLSARTPALRLPHSACGVWAETLGSTTMPLWQEAWRNWCRQRQLPTNEVEICSLTYRAPRLEVPAPARLVQRLQATKSDLLRGEAWLLAGEGYLRAAALLALK